MATSVNDAKFCVGFEIGVEIDQIFASSSNHRKTALFRRHLSLGSAQRYLFLSTHVSFDSGCVTNSSSFRFESACVINSNLKLKPTRFNRNYFFLRFNRSYIFLRHNASKSQCNVAVHHSNSLVHPTLPLTFDKAAPRAYTVSNIFASLLDEKWAALKP